MIWDCGSVVVFGYVFSWGAIMIKGAHLQFRIVIQRLFVVSLPSGATKTWPSEYQPSWVS